MNRPTDVQIAAAAQAKVARALALIERAQNDLGSACAELSALTGGVPVWRACHKLTDQVHKFWYRVHHWRGGGKFSLDSTNIDALARAIAKQQEGATP